ncbi:Hsp70 family protein [Kitasatospora sp. NPDC059747]|uniref:caspase, EACC1-associated type n=1 Tax=Kitasatospora sp. NPDC059747 TaxID=3346930 RepID=UPI00365B5862
MIIVNQHYLDPGLTELPGAAADAEQLKSVLADPKIGGFTVDVVAEGTAHACRRAIQAFFRSATKDDILLLHLSCHGRKDSRNRLHFAASDTEIDVFEATAVSAEFLADQMEQSPSHRTVALLDCCYSGAFTRGLRTRAGAEEVDVGEPFSGRAQVVITSSTSLQFSYESESRSRGTEPSVFTSAVVAGLRDGSADLDRDGYVSTDDLYDYVHDRVSSNHPQQTPTRTVNAAEGRLYLARNPRGFVADPAISEGLRSAILATEEWPRVGALHELERLLASARADVRRAAKEALLHLVHAEHTKVSQNATQLWQWRGLGVVPDRPSRIDRSVAPGDRIVAIDFGTTNSSIAVFTDGEAQIVPNRWGFPTTPSMVAIDADGNRFFGDNAARLAESDLAAVVRNVKLKLGTDWRLEHQGASYSAEQVASWVLAELRQDAEIELGQQVTRAVMTIPAGFTARQRAALTAAAALADLTVIRMINEPTAAAMPFSLEGEREETVIVFDLGGGTLDVTLVEISDGVCDVKRTGGDSSLGGADWDQRIADHMTAEFTALHGVRPTGRNARHRLLEAAERAKKELSYTSSTRITIPHLVTQANGSLHLDLTLTRSRLDELTADLLQRCRAAFNQLLEPDQYGFPYPIEDVDRVVLVGGASRIPAVTDLISELSGQAPDRDIIVEGVVVGAAVQSGVLAGDQRTGLLLDVASHTLGVWTSDGRSATLVDRHTTIPTKRSELFTTAVDGQPRIAIGVLEGEHTDADRNELLGMLQMELTLSPVKGVPRVEVTFSVDADGMLTVTAHDLGVGTTESLTVDLQAADHARRHPPDPTCLPALAAGSDPAIPEKPST